MCTSVSQNLHTEISPLTFAAHYCSNAFKLFISVITVTSDFQ